MAQIHVPDSIPVRFAPRAPRPMIGGLILVGGLAFVGRLVTDPQAAWISYVSNWLFFTSIAAGAVMFAAATTIVKARWNWSLRRLSVAGAAFLPVAFVLLVPMLFLREGYFPWIEAMATDPIVQKKAAYLNVPFFMTRNIVGPLVLFAMAVYFAYLAVRPDMGRLDPATLDAGQRTWRERLMAGWAGQEAEESRSREAMARLAPALALVYAAVMSFVIYDFAMSLEPHWFSTLFGGWYFMAAFWGGIAFTAFAGMWLRGTDPELARAIGIQQRHDIGKLTFAFTVFWAYLFFAQYIVIWYGKLPWEQIYMVKRAGEGWGAYSVGIVLLCFVIPFAALLGRKAKIAPTWLRAVTLLVLFGLWGERYWLVAPTLVDHYDGMATIYHFAIGLGFLGLFLASVRWFLATFPVIQLWQPAPQAEMLEAEVAVAE
ncbi:MAG: hypothetical protein RQ751_04380 [Longimicrobiales bacterium]|nr:hypothetical protein [Longimicrobiales bacterium]